SGSWRLRAALEDRVEHPVVRYSNRRVRLHSLPLTPFLMQHSGHPDRNALTSHLEVPMTSRPANAALAEPFYVIEPDVNPELRVRRRFTPYSHQIVIPLGPLVRVGANTDDTRIARRTPPDSLDVRTRQRVQHISENLLDLG